jgi:predicted RNase H-like nuclease
VTAPPAPRLTVTGVDGCARGWVVVTLMAPFPPALFDGSVFDVTAVTMAATLDELPLAAVTGIDMPLGLVAVGWRDADRLAKRALGRRGSTVFAIPPRPALEAASHAEASRTCRELTGQGLSVQAYGLRRKIAEAEQYRRRAAADPGGVRLHEVHPELAFAALAGGAPVPDSKHTPAGLATRRDLLHRAGLRLPPKSLPGLAEHDLLDAAAVAWSARRIAVGLAVTLASPGQRADDGSEIAVRY